MNVRTYTKKDGTVVLVQESVEYTERYRSLEPVWTAKSRIDPGSGRVSEMTVQGNWRWLVVWKIRRAHREHVSVLERSGLL